MKNLRHRTSSQSLKSSPAIVFLFILILSGSTCLSRSQTNDSDPDNNLPLVEHTNVPPYATFWFLSTFDTNNWYGFGPPLPYSPFSTNLDVPIYYWQGNSYVVDDTVLPADQQEQYFRTNQSQTEMLVMSGNEFSGGGEFGRMDADYSYPSNYLWLSIEGVSNSIIYITAHGTVPDAPYDLLSREHLTNTGWITEGSFIGAENQDSTPLTIAVGTRTNELYFWARSGGDDGSGLPLWWQLQYFGYTGVDPYGDPDGDGWLTIQEYQNNTNPTIPNQPPAPDGLSVAYQDGTTSVKVTWNVSQGPVLYYVVERTVPELQQTNYFQVTAPANVLNDTYPLSNPRHGDAGIYRVQAHYAIGDSPWSPPSTLYRYYDPYFDGDNTAFVWITPGQGGHIYLATPPPRFRGGTGNLILHFVNFVTGIDTFTNWTFSADVLTNGPCQIADYMLPALNGYALEWFLDTINSNGTRVASIRVQVNESQGFSYWFFDAREQLQQNLAFWLRASPTYQPFTFRGYQGGIGVYPSDYLYSSFYEPYESDTVFGADVYAFTPYDLNYTFRNFAFDQSLVDGEGNLTTGAQGNFDNMWVSGNGTYEFEPPTNFVNISALLSPSQSQWIYHPFFQSFPESVGLQDTGTNTVTLLDNATNFFGLQFLSAKIAFGANPATFTNLYPTGWLPWPPDPLNPAYSETIQPLLSTVGYYFCQPGIHLMPGHTNFMTTNTTPPLIVGLGQPSRIAGYAKQAILNGDPSKFAYLGQYFDKAYKMTNGTVTSEETGVVSPYGDFFPTEPGQVALRTMTNFGVNERGTAVVNVISLALDANHDSAIDTSFAGPDFTSLRDPFVFWVNNDYDRVQFDTEDKTNYEDSVEVPSLPWWNRVVLGQIPPPDAEFRDAANYRIIPTVRDLQDFARLWICGLSTNVIASLPPDTAISLSWGDVGNLNTNNPGIDVFQAADADGGIGYLTNATTAAFQTNTSNCRYIGRLGPGDSLPLNGDQFSSGWAGDHFIWCGAATGTGHLTLTISQGGTNTLAQTSAFIQLAQIKQLYERWTVGDNPQIPPTNFVHAATEGVPSSFQYGTLADSSTPYILFVHGWNLSPYMKERFAETAFKRLYWQGYQGRFGLFRWPTDFGFAGDVIHAAFDPDNFDRSEFQAWRSAAGLCNHLANLNARYPGHVYVMAHSLGNEVVGEALRLADTNRLVNTYVVSQAAVSAHTYDSTVPDYPFFPYSKKTPNIYGNRFAALSGNGAGRVINFYNTNDYAFRFVAWQTDQLLKPDSNVHQSDGAWTYAYNGSVNDPSPWNNFYKFDFVDSISNAVIFDIVGNLTNRYEVMAFAAQSWTTALGATAGSLNNMSAGVDLGRISNPRIWLPDTVHPDDPYDEHLYHSAQFRGPYWQQQGYWSELLGQEGFRLSQ